MDWNRPVERDQGSGIRDRERGKFPFHGLVAGAIVVLGAAVAAWWLWPEGDTRQDAASTKKGLIREVTPAVRVRAPEPVQTATNEPLAKLPKPKIPVGNVITAKSNVGRIETHADGSVVTSKFEVVFKRPFERALQVALRPGGFGASSSMAMQHRYSEDQILQMLKEITRPEPEDDERVAALKDRVQKLKEDMLLEIMKGRTVGEVLDDLRRQCATERGMLNLADKTVREATRCGDVQKVRETLEKTNQILEKNGLAPRQAPPQFARQIRELEVAERAERAEKANRDAEALTRAMNESIE